MVNLDPSISPDVRPPSNAVKRKLIALTRSHTTAMGAVVLAVFGLTPSKPPAYGHGAVVGDPNDPEDDTVRCDLLAHDGSYHAASVISTMADVRDNFRRLCDEAKLSDDDRRSVFGELRKWIKKDWRARSDWDKLR
jgi:hypothetical protein